MSPKVYENNEEAVKDLLETLFENEYEELVRDFNGTNKSSFSVTVADKNIFLSIDEPETSATHSLGFERAKRKHNFLSAASQNIEDDPIFDNTDYAAIAKEQGIKEVDKIDARHKVEANFPRYFENDREAVFEIHVWNKDRTEVLRKAVTITHNYVANEAGEVLSHEEGEEFNEPHTAYIFGKAYAAVFERLAKKYNIDRLKEELGEIDSYSPELALAHLSIIHPNPEQIRNIGYGFFYNDAKREIIENDKGFISEYEGKLKEYKEKLKGYKKKLYKANSYASVNEEFELKEPYEGFKKEYDDLEKEYGNFRKEYDKVLRCNAKIRADAIDKDVLYQKGEDIVSGFKDTAQSVYDSYSKIGDELSVGPVHIDPWTDNIIRHFMSWGANVENRHNHIPNPTSKYNPNSVITSKLIDNDNAGVSYRAMDIALTLNAMSGITLDQKNKTVSFTESGKALLRGADEVRHLEANFEKNILLLVSAAKVMVGNMRLGKYAHEDFDKRWPIKQIEEAKSFVEAFKEGWKVDLNFLTPPQTLVASDSRYTRLKTRFPQLA